MKVLLLTNPKIMKSPYIKLISKMCDLTVLDIKKNNFTKVSIVDLVILLTDKIISKKSITYKTASSFSKKNKIKMIEVAFLKSSIDKEESSTNAIIHGLGDMTWQAIEKIIRNN